MLLRIPACNQYQEIMAGRDKKFHLEASQEWVWPASGKWQGDGGEVHYLWSV
jgi:hypothetical protein